MYLQGNVSSQCSQSLKVCTCADTRVEGRVLNDDLKKGLFFIIHFEKKNE